MFYGKTEYREIQKDCSEILFRRTKKSFNFCLTRQEKLELQISSF